MIIKNAIKCNKCGDEIESTYRHNFVTCKCGACSVDGGYDYLRRCGNSEDWTDLSICKSDESPPPLSVSKSGGDSLKGNRK